MQNSYHMITLEVAGDPVDFIPAFNHIKKDLLRYNAVRDVINNLKHDKLVGIRIKQKQIPQHYIKKHDVNAVFKVDLPGYWRLIYGILVIHGEKKALLMELFDHAKYNKRFGY
ncbi:hypothetical protein DYY66_0713 [Candidatus Nitrosotalea sp. FS]|nr:hypothetical protein [Candidatus Nitrosotalea sp. FS]